MPDHHHHHHDDAERIGTAFVLNLLFTIIELVGGFWTNSIAILSDALHDLGDSISLGAAWYFQRLSGRKRDARFSYGYKRFSVLGALITAVVLLLGSVFIILHAVPRLWAPEMPDARGMIWLAVLGVLFNGAAVWRLQSGKSLNAKVVSWHLLEDVLGWVAVLIGSIVMYFFDWPIIDPLLSIGITLYILYNVFKNLKSALKIFLQGIPGSFDTGEIVAELKLSFPEIHDIHDVHLWTMDGEMNVMTMHVVLAEEKPLQALSRLKQDIRNALDALHIHHLTLEFETKDERCELEDC